MKIKKDWGTILYQCSWALVLVYLLIFQYSKYSEYNMDIIKYSVAFICIILLGIKVVFFDKYNIKSLIIMFLLSIIMLLIYLNVKELIILITLVFLLSSKNVNFEKIIYTDMITRVFCIAFLFISVQFNLINNFSRTINGNFKSAFGFDHPNTFGIIQSIALIEWLYLNRKSLSFKHFVVSLFVFLFMSNFSASRTMIYTLLFTGLVAIIIKIVPKIINLKIIKTSFTYIIPFMALISFTLVFAYHHEIPGIKRIDNLLTNRLFLSDWAFKKFDITLFGTKVLPTDEQLKDPFYYKKIPYIDNAYVRLLLECGIIYFIIFCSAYVLLCKNLIKENKIGELMIIFFFAVVGIAEICTYKFFFNFTIILVWNYLEKKEKEYSIYEEIKRLIQ